MEHWFEKPSNIEMTNGITIEEKNETDEKREFTIYYNYCKFDPNRSKFHFHFK